MHKFSGFTLRRHHHRDRNWQCHCVGRQRNVSRFGVILARSPIKCGAIVQETLLALVTYLGGDVFSKHGD